MQTKTYSKDCWIPAHKRHNQIQMKMQPAPAKTNNNNNKVAIGQVVEKTSRATTTNFLTVTDYSIDCSAFLACGNHDWLLKILDSQPSAISRLALWQTTRRKFDCDIIHLLHLIFLKTFDVYVARDTPGTTLTGVPDRGKTFCCQSRSTVSQLHDWHRKSRSLDHRENLDSFEMPSISTVKTDDGQPTLWFFGLGLGSSSSTR